MARQYKLTGVTADRVDQVVADFESEGAIVNKIPEPGGAFTVIATFP